MPLHNRFPQLRDSGNDRIPGKVRLDGSDRSVLYMAGSREVGFAGPKVNQLCTLGPQPGSLRGHGHGG
jgi:hypothetical protein